MKRTTCSIGAFAAAVLLATILVAAPVVSDAKEPAVTFHRNVVYGKAGDVELTLNLALPAGATAKTPVVLLFHGGAWIAGRKEWHDPMTVWLASNGYAAATADYRLAPRNPWPAQIEDAKCAVRYLRANADKWNIDPDRIAAWGFSAGAHLSMLLGAMGPEDGLEGAGGHPDCSSQVNAVVSFYGPTDLDPEATTRREEVGKMALAQVLGPVFAAAPGKASPIGYVSEGDAPMILFQGTSDQLVPYRQTVDMLERLVENEVAAEIVFLVGEGHAWRRDPAITDTVRAGLRFLDNRFRPNRNHSIRQDVLPAIGRPK